MDSEIKLYLTRAEDEFFLANKDLELSIDPKIKDLLGAPNEKTFYHSVISHAYYSIFYSAKAYLLSKGIRTKVPDEHKKTYYNFKKFVDNRILDKDLLEIYEDAILKAETLLKIFFDEKRKRGIFVYNVKSEANLPYAQESIKKAKKFVSSIKAILEGQEN